MKRIMAILAVAFAFALLPTSLSASEIFTAHCENGDFAVQTVDMGFFGDDTSEGDDYFRELAEIICAQHGSVPREP